MASSSGESALPLVVLAEHFAKLPGIGMKSAQRLAYHVLSMSSGEVEDFAKALLGAKSAISKCPLCQNLTDLPTCNICQSPERDKSLICVVESPKDVGAIERTREYKGVYHVLHGLISPLDGVTPENLQIGKLLDRVKSGGVTEIIMATNPTVEGEATAIYLYRLLTPLGIRVTRLAFGLPMGGTLEFADEVTLFQAIQHRRDMD